MSAHATVGATVCKKIQSDKNLKIFFLFSKIIHVTDATFKAFNLAKTRNVVFFFFQSTT
jgi:hypothetical protein